ncbi:MAG: S8 family serine peptidase [Promethearchaeia archaeon]
MEGNKLYPLFEDIFSSFNKNEAIRCIISFKDEAVRERFKTELSNDEILCTINVIPSIVANLSKSKISKLKSRPEILQIEQDQVLKQSILDTVEHLNITEYKTSQIVFTGNGVKIGIIDDGINNDLGSIRGTVFQKLSLKGSAKKGIKNPKELTNNQFSHGSLMANLLVNQFLTQDDVLLGICPEAQIYDIDISKNYDIDVSKNSRSYYISDILQSFDLLVQKKLNLDILLIPLSSVTPSDGNDILSKACNLFTKKGIAIVCPSGNCKDDVGFIGTPGAAKEVITIGALTKSNRISDFTPQERKINNQIKPELYFPGESIQIPLTQYNRITTTGTSASAAIAAGFVTLLKEFNSELTPIQIKDILTEASNFYNAHSDTMEKVRTFTLVDLFKILDLYERPVLPYNYLIKRSIKASIEYVLILIIIFYMPIIFNIIKSYLSKF